MSGNPVTRIDSFGLKKCKFVTYRDVRGALIDTLLEPTENTNVELVDSYYDIRDMEIPSAIIDDGRDPRERKGLNLQFWFGRVDVYKISGEVDHYKVYEQFRIPFYKCTWIMYRRCGPRYKRTQWKEGDPVQIEDDVEYVGRHYLEGVLTEEFIPLVPLFLTN